MESPEESIQRSMSWNQKTYQARKKNIAQWCKKKVQKYQQKMQN